MFFRKLKKGEALVLINNEESIVDTAIHTFFVFFPIDVVWLDKNKKIVDFRKNIRPFTPLVVPKKSAKYVVEMAGGSIKKGFRTTSE